MDVTCKICHKIYVYDRKRNNKKTTCGNCYTKMYRKRMKKKCAEYKGGSCIRCGYNKCMSSLVFHHKDPTQKDFGISANGMLRAWNKVKEELDKCILLCQNCHCEIHEEIEYSKERNLASGIAVNYLTVGSSPTLGVVYE